MVSRQEISCREPDFEPPRLVLMSLYLAFLCPRLYWTEYFYVANVVKVFSINLFCSTYVILFITIKLAMGFSIVILTHMASVLVT